MKAVHFGSGNIGRGFIAKILLKSGFDFTFVDVNKKIIDSLNYHKEYNIKLVGYNFEKIINIKNFHAIYIDHPNILNVISNSNLITTAIGVNSLNKITSILIEGIKLKIKLKSKIPLNIIACENKIKASSYLKEIILKHFPLKYHEYFNQYIGFVDCSIDTIIPSMISFEKNNLSLIAENFQEWIVDKRQFKGIIPNITNMTISNNLRVFIDRKFLTLNTGHAIAAYLGAIKKYKTIYESIKDNEIEDIVKNSMKESGLTLIKKYRLNKKNHFFYIDKILTRFKNPFLLDKVKRIARNPLQKLGKNERLITPLLLTKKYNLLNSNLIKGIAAALHYKNKDDLESIKMSNLIKKLGIKFILNKISNLELNSKEIDLIFHEYNKIYKIFFKELYS
ncbi:Mannitol-1-phosphate 5-dehydrogenase [Buchnera aphidicola (Protaphis terricola)]|uniref:mannitol-1-phosphate 5-dehydrogenase n=1 Tax=Buchnera aphidicola TaxID=9 RepID=UPI003464A865